jgi:hypothetical protein
MTAHVQGLLKKYNVKTLKELSKKLKISLDKVKNVSSGRTSRKALFTERSQYRVFPERSRELAELIGVTLGDGNIFQFKRCQRLTISCNSSYKAYTEHVRDLVGGVLKKEPSVLNRSQANCSDVRIYMQDIDKALGLPVGNKIKNSVEIPEWIFGRKPYLIKCLKGLFETDGHYGLNRKFYVEYIQFCNKSGSLKLSVFRALKSLGYSPQLGSTYVRLARKMEVRRFIREVRFERPFPSLVN